MTDRKDIHSFSLVAIIGAVIVIYSLTLGYWSAKIIPLIIGSLIFILATGSLVRTIVRLKTSAGSTTSQESKGGKSLRRYLPVTLWLGGLFIGITLFGILISTPIFLVGYAKTHGSKWLQSFLFGVAATAIIYGLFVIIFKVDLYSGILFIGY